MGAVYAVPRGERRRWGAEQRLEFIELRAYWDGSLNRADIREQFGVSAPQASTDIAAYMDVAPRNLVYDGSRKRYLASESFSPRLVTPAAEMYLGWLAGFGAARGSTSSWVGAVPEFAATPIPGRAVDAEVLRALLAAMREQASIDVVYQSMSPGRPSPQRRRITPHALATDGLRWHVRAFCHEDSSFKDFILSRIRETGLHGDPGPLGERDIDWNTLVEVGLIPNPDLSAEQQRAVDWDYSMNGAARLELSVRRALLYYLRQRLRLDVPHDRPAERPVVLERPDDFGRQIAAATGGVST